MPFDPCISPGGATQKVRVDTIPYRHDSLGLYKNTTKQFPNNLPASK
jgi:hypothetical protein